MCTLGVKNPAVSFLWRKQKFSRPHIESPVVGPFGPGGGGGGGGGKYPPSSFLTTELAAPTPSPQPPQPPQPPALPEKKRAKQQQAKVRLLSVFVVGLDGVSALWF